MSSRRVRFTSLFVVLAAALAITGLVAPGASAEGFQVAFVAFRGPTDAQAGATITSAPWDPAGAPVQVLVTSNDEPVPNVEVTLVFTEGSETGGEGNLEGNVATTGNGETGENGVATFADLVINEANEPLSTSYVLEPTAEEPPPPIELTSATIASVVTGPASSPFDIWDKGCRNATGCQLQFQAFDNGEGPLLREDTYSVGANIGLGASELTSSQIGITCPTQKLIYGNDVFFHATPSAGDTVILVTHITALAMKRAANNGQKHVGWCVGLKSAAPWIKNGASYQTQTVGGQTLFVGLAPKCPNKKTAPNFAPCILSQMSDGFGGSFIRGYLPGGDPPRRT